MIVKCVSEYPSEEQIRMLGPEFDRNQLFSLTIGCEYVVLGLDFFIKSELFGTGTYVQYADEINRLGWAPLCLFAIIDSRASRFWEARMYEDGITTLQPPSFYIGCYHDDLSEHVPEVVEDFQRVRALLEYEATGRWVTSYTG